VTSNKQFEPTVIRRHMRAASAPFHYAHAARWTRGRAAAQLRRYAARAMRSLTLLLFLAPAIGAAQERVIGLVEIPTLHASVNEGGSDSAAAPVTLFAVPDQQSAAAAVVLNRRQLESREHGYEQVSAAVYATVANSSGGSWYKLRYSADEHTLFGWLNPADAGEYRDVHALVEHGLPHFTDQWDRRIFEAPRLDARAKVLQEGRDVRVIDIYYEQGETAPWYLLAVVRGSCTGEPLEIVMTGWVPAYAATGGNNVWYYSRGC
jgi:hypothetical protein